ncbi:hypothetical protein EVAR_10997_1 [Eumeta japonica]|uniref:Uncharacterized protein n=1 Tax=Eumeta variegata TaxID=151549 RepID=A0A4C1YNF4_EUMVA|nr:hypothetical protein EVAR_10997_1 [Eumeta japonica]
MSSRRRHVPRSGVRWPPPHILPTYLLTNLPTSPIAMIFQKRSSSSRSTIALKSAYVDVGRRPFRGERRVSVTASHNGSLEDTRPINGFPIVCAGPPLAPDIYPGLLWDDHRRFYSGTIYIQIVLICNHFGCPIWRSNVATLLRLTSQPRSLLAIPMWRLDAAGADGSLQFSRKKNDSDHSRREKFVKNGARSEKFVSQSNEACLPASPRNASAITVMAGAA